MNPVQLSSLVQTGTTSKWFATNPREHEHPARHKKTAEPTRAPPFLLEHH
jgi:hypothetical protein